MIKTPTKYFISFNDPNNLNVQRIYLFNIEASVTFNSILASSSSVSMDHTIQIMADPNYEFAVLWTADGRYCVVRISGVIQSV